MKSISDWLRLAKEFSRTLKYLSLLTVSKNVIHRFLPFLLGVGWVSLWAGSCSPPPPSSLNRFVLLVLCCFQHRYARCLLFACRRPLHCSQQHLHLQQWSARPSRRPAKPLILHHRKRMPLQPLWCWGVDKTHCGHRRFLDARCQRQRQSHKLHFSHPGPCQRPPR